MKFYLILLSCLIFKRFGSAKPSIALQTPRRETLAPVSTLFSATSRPDLWANLNKRQTTSRVVTSTCGFETGDPSKPRSANPGFDCRVDTDNGLWGFCPTTVNLPSDCGIAGSCFDGSGCLGGCGIIGVAGITTITCNAAGQDFCSTAWLIDGPSQTYAYIACGPNSSAQTLLAEASATSPATSSTGSSGSNTALYTAAVSTSSTSMPSSTSMSSVLSQSALTASSTSLAIVPNPVFNTSTPTPRGSPKSNIGAIVGGVLGGLTLIGFFVLAAIFLLRKHRRSIGNSNAGPQPSAPEKGRDNPKMLASKDASSGQSKGIGCSGSGPSELSARQETLVELGG
ncbi:hypothetical protein B7494_g3549 [Chlorociboria aeruginascens]|nr:hypothetical protein B7494_g3549 [Chlorociboria aeruginascens]